jgi:GT2 family glycosyltransferase
MYDLPFGRALEAEQREKEWLDKDYLSDFRDGSAFMLTRKVWGEIGDFDENYGFGWGEDIDYLFRLEQAGYQFKTDKRVNSHHIGMASGYALGNQNMIDLNGTMDRNKEYTKTKWGLDEFGNPAFRRESA